MGLVYSEPACQSAYDGDVHRLYEVLRQDPNDLNAQDHRSGDTPLIAACRRAKLPAVQYLLHNRADVHLTNKKQRTCLHYAAKRTLTLFDHIVIIILMPILLLGYFLMLQKKRKSVALMQEILKSDVNVSAVDYKGNTALHYVCQKKSHHLLPLLLDRNADTNIRNNDGETPLDIATRLKFKKIIYLLRKAS